MPAMENKHEKRESIPITKGSVFWLITIEVSDISIYNKNKYIKLQF